MHSDTLQTLIHLGFSEYEARAYRALVELGNANAREISDKSGVPQGKIYQVLHRLADRGVVQIQEGSPVYFYAEDPVGAVLTMKNEMNNGIDNLVTDFMNVRPEENELAPFLVIRSNWGIMNRLKSLIRNAEHQIVIYAIKPDILTEVYQDLRRAERNVDLRIYADDASQFEHVKTEIREVKDQMEHFFSDFNDGENNVFRHKKKYTELFIVVDGYKGLVIETSVGQRRGVVMQMPEFCYILSKMLLMFDPVEKTTLSVVLPASE